VPGLDQTAVRRINTSVVLRVLAASAEEVTLQWLTGRTGLSRRTIEIILVDLLADGWVVESPLESDGGAGRPARRFRFAVDRRFVAGARIDTHSAHAIVADLTGRVLGRGERLLGDDYFVPERAVARAAEAIAAAVEDAGVDADRIVAGGVAAGGVIDPVSGVVVRLVNAPRWSRFPLADAFISAFGVPWVADNDANLAALAELRHGVAAGYDHVAWIIHGQRTGVGFIVGGELHRGFRGAAGEIIESRVLGLARDPKREIGLLTSPDAEGRARARAMIADALAGDAVAIQEARALAFEIADVVDIIAWTIAPELVVLGGGLEDGAELIVPLLEDRLRELGAPDVRILPSSVRADAPLVGAVLNALDHIDVDLYGPAVN
jgi:predicted NBD/HSP70 family sugar kinase